MPNSPEGGQSEQPAEADVQLSFDQLMSKPVEAQPEPRSSEIVVPEPRIPIEVSKAMGQNRLKAAQDEIDRRVEGGYSSPRLVREAIGDAAMTPEDIERKGSRRIAAQASKVHKARSSKSHRARFKDTTDYVIRELNSDQPMPKNPDEDIDKAFGSG